MFNHLRKYRSFFTLGLLGFYLAGGLQFPILECLHFLTHLDDLATGNYEKHNFHSHDESTHKHLALNVLDNLDRNGQDAQIPVNETTDLTTKKFPQIVSLNATSEFSQVEETLLIFAFARELKGMGPPVPSPPPRV